MASTEANLVQEVVDQINNFKMSIEKAGEEGRNKLKSINIAEVCNKIPFTPDKKIDTTEWSKRPEEEQKNIYDQLTLIRDALQAAAELDGPTNPKHIMYAEYASNTTIVIWILFGFLLTATLLVGIVYRWSQATGTDYTKKIENATKALTILKESVDKTNRANIALINAKSQLAAARDEKTRKEAQKDVEIRDTEVEGMQSKTTALQAATEKKSFEAIKAIQEGGANETTVLIMVILLGALGGSLHLVSSLVIFIGNRNLKRSWLLYYLAMPFTGAGLTPVIYMLLRVGLINPSGTASNGGGIANLNLVAIYAFAVMTGMFSRVALDKLSDVFKTLFRTDTTSKDALGTQKQQGGTVPSEGKTAK